MREAAMWVHIPSVQIPSVQIPRMFLDSRAHASVWGGWISSQALFPALPKEGGLLTGISLCSRAFFWVLSRRRKHLQQRGEQGRGCPGYAARGQSKAAELTQPLRTHLLSAHLLSPQTALGQQARLQAAGETRGQIHSVPPDLSLTLSSPSPTT